MKQWQRDVVTGTLACILGLGVMIYSLLNANTDSSYFILAVVGGVFFALGCSMFWIARLSYRLDQSWTRLDQLLDEMTSARTRITHTGDATMSRRTDEPITSNPQEIDTPSTRIWSTPSFSRTTLELQKALRRQFRFAIIIVILSFIATTCFILAGTLSLLEGQTGWIFSYSCAALNLATLTINILNAVKAHKSLHGRRRR